MSELDASVSEVKLQRYTYMMSRVLSRNLVEHIASEPNYEIAEDMISRMSNTMFEQIRYHIYGRQLDTLEFHRPLNWKEACKHALYKWLLYHFEYIGEVLATRYPPIYEKNEVAIYAYYPLIPVEDGVLNYSVYTMNYRRKVDNDFPTDPT